VDDRRRDSVLIDAALDAARVTDDFVRGVVGLGGGRIGDDKQRMSLKDRILKGRGQRGVVMAMTAQYAPEQLRKAAIQATELVAAVDDLGGAWTPPALDAAGQLSALGVQQIPEILRDPDVGARSPALRDVHDRLGRAISVLNEARSKVILIEMRTARDQA
jgi:hypothetical protein